MESRGNTCPHSGLYHEKQHLALCAVHATNNLLQSPACTKGDFDAACEQLLAPSQLQQSSYYYMYWLTNNPHRSVFGIGNYDVNVIMMVLEQKFGLQVTWHDSRKELNACDLEKQQLRGILWNVPAVSFLGRLTRGRHWVALLLLDNEKKHWMNLDSNLSEPVDIGSHEACIRLLNSSRVDSHILLVHSATEE